VWFPDKCSTLRGSPIPTTRAHATPATNGANCERGRDDRGEAGEPARSARSSLASWSGP
jgi:hypothetical protein